MIGKLHGNAVTKICFVTKISANYGAFLIAQSSVCNFSEYCTCKILFDMHLT